jgi:hypothetical protein
MDDRRIKRLRAGDWSFGHDGMHNGVGTIDCPYLSHHHHDVYCDLPTIDEVLAAGIDLNEFRVRSRVRRR